MSILMEIVTSIIAMHIVKSVSQKTNICSLLQEWRASGERLRRTCHRKPSNAHDDGDGDDDHEMKTSVFIFFTEKCQINHFDNLLKENQLTSAAAVTTLSALLRGPATFYQLGILLTNYDMHFCRSESYKASVFKVRTCLMAFSLSGEQTQPHSSKCGEEVPGRLRLPCRQCVRS